MGRWSVTFTRSQWTHVDIQAENETDAMAKAYAHLANGEIAYDQANMPSVIAHDMSELDALDAARRR